MAKRRLDCPYIFHRNGRRIGDFRKVWQKRCDAIGLSDRIVHDLRRSGVRHLIDAGNDPHTVMAFSGHQTDSMLKRYHIINVDDLRRAAERGSAYTGRAGQVVPLARRATREPGENPESGHGKLTPEYRAMPCRVTEFSATSAHLPAVHTCARP